VALEERTPGAQPTATIRCPECDSPIGTIKELGAVYICNNRKHVKVGRTSQGLRKRVEQLNDAGVGDHFKIAAVFASSDPVRDEAKAHKRLRRRFGHIKELYTASPAEVTVEVRGALGYVDPVEIRSSLRPAYEALKERFKIERAVAKERLG
jgi:hypothetical protein